MSILSLKVAIDTYIIRMEDLWNQKSTTLFHLGIQEIA